MLVNIQFLRFVAAMLVVAYHVSFQIPGGALESHGLYWMGRTLGYAGVDVFFVISGFIMAYTTLEDTGLKSGFDFTRRRLARIFSGYWPFFFLALAVFSWARPQHFAESGLLASFFLWPQPLNRVLLEITWTLSFELYFYLLFALVILLVPRRHRMVVAFGIAAAVLALGLYRHLALDRFGSGNLHLMSFAEHFLVSPFVVEFFAGAVTAYWLVRRPRGMAWTFLLAGSVLFLYGSVFNTQYFSGHLEQGYHVVPRVLLFGTASVLIVAGLVRLESRGRTTHRRFSIQTGGASYAIYLSHVPILTVAQALGLPGALGGSPRGLTAAVYGVLMLLILAISVAHYNRLERPLYRLFKRGLGIRKPR